MNEKNQYLYIKVKVGSHKEQRKLILDTSSCFTWLPRNSSNFVLEGPAAGKRRGIDCLNSTTCRYLNGVKGKTHLILPKGRVTGDIAVDRFSIGADERLDVELKFLDAQTTKGMP